MAQVGRKRIYTAEEAISDIIAFVEAEEDSVEEDDLEELYGVDDENEFSYVEENESDNEENVTETVIVGRVYKKKKLTTNRLVHSISSALDENNYYEVLLPQAQPKACTAFLTPARSGTPL